MFGKLWKPCTFIQISNGYALRCSRNSKICAIKYFRDLNQKRNNCGRKKWSQVRNMKHRTKNPQNEIWFVQRQSWQHCFRRNQLYYNPWYLVLQNSELKIFSCLNVNFLRQELGVILSSCKVDFFVLNGRAKVPFTSLRCIKHELIHSSSVDLSLLYLVLVQVFV